MSKAGRQKGGGFLDTFFRGQKPSKNGSDVPTARPTSYEGEDFKQLEIEIDSWTEKMIDKKLSEILEDMNIPQAKREPLLKHTLEKKKHMLKGMLKGIYLFLNLFVGGCFLRSYFFHFVWFKWILKVKVGATRTTLCELDFLSFSYCLWDLFLFCHECFINKWFRTGLQISREQDFLLVPFILVLSRLFFYYR